MKDKVKLSTILQGFEMVDDMTTVFLNLETLEIECSYLNDGVLEESEEDKFEDDKYISFPSQWEINVYKWMETFAQTYKDKKISIGLQVALVGNGAFQRFKLAIQAYEISDEWFKYKKERYIESAKKWCGSNNIEYINDVE